MCAAVGAASTPDPLAVVSALWDATQALLSAQLAAVRKSGLDPNSDDAAATADALIPLAAATVLASENDVIAALPGRLAIAEALEVWPLPDSTARDRVRFTLTTWQAATEHLRALSTEGKAAARRRPPAVTHGPLRVSLADQCAPGGVPHPGTNAFRQSGLQLGLHAAPAMPRFEIEALGDIAAPVVDADVAPYSLDAVPSRFRLAQRPSLLEEAVPSPGLLWSPLTALTRRSADVAVTPTAANRQYG
jgi:hypothetical protein